MPGNPDQPARCLALEKRDPSFSPPHKKAPQVETVMNRKEEAALDRIINENLIGLSRGQKIRLSRKLFGGRQRAIDDFLVMDAHHWKQSTTETVILHLPSMCWRSFNMPFELAVKQLRAKESLPELLDLIVHQVSD
jgi:hypothetical protein